MLKSWRIGFGWAYEEKREYINIWASYDQHEINVKSDITSLYLVKLQHFNVGTTSILLRLSRPIYQSNLYRSYQNPTSGRKVNLSTISWCKDFQ